MQKLTIKTRVRTAGEAVSLGFLLGKQYFFVLWLNVVLATLPVLTAAALLGWALHSWSWAWLILWWAKPWTERPAVAALSRLVFARPWHLRDIAGDWRQSLGHHLWAELLWRRPFAGNRIMRHAVSLLEDVEGQALRDRLNYMNRFAAAGKNTMIMLGFSLIENGLMLNAILFLFKLLPEKFLTLTALPALLRDPVFLGLLFILSALIFSVSSVFYVAVGFTGYLNRRIISEGWAIALDLRALAARLPVIILLAAALTAVIPQARAQYSSDAYIITGCRQNALVPCPALALTAAQMAQDRDYLVHEAHRPAVTPFARRKVFVPGNARQQLPIGFRPGEIAGQWIKGLIITALLLLLLWLISRVLSGRRQMRSGERRVQQTDKRPAGIVFSTPEALAPTALLHQVRQRLQQGQQSAALSLLYRASLQQLQQQFGIDCPLSAAEEECRQCLNAQVPVAVKRYFDALTQAWQLVAYAGQTLPAEQLEQLSVTFAELWH